MRKPEAFRPILIFAAGLALVLGAPPAAAMEEAPQRLLITPTGPAPENGIYAAGDDIEFLIDHAGSDARLKFSGRDEIFYLTSEPSTLGGRVLKYDTGEVAIAVSGWGGVTIYTESAPNGIPAERTGEAESLELKNVSARDTQIFAAQLSQRLASRDNLAVGFAANWEAISREDGVRALALDAMRNAAYALADLAASRATRGARAAGIHVVRIVAGEAQSISVEGEAVAVTFNAGGGPSERPSSRAIAEAIEAAP